MEQLLIIEDDIGLNQGLSKALKADDRQIISCHDLKAAREQLLCGGVSLILLDINLPDGSGLELLREVKENTPYIPVILLTANDTDLDIVDGLERGADDYITKPFSLSVLRARVNTQLRKQASNHKNAPFHMDLFHFDFEAMTFYVDVSQVDCVVIEKSLASQALFRLRDIDVYSVNYPHDYRHLFYFDFSSFRFSFKDLLKMILILILCTLIGKGFMHFQFLITTPIMIYILGIVFVSIWTSGYIYSLLASLFSVLCFNFFFTYPYFSLLSDPSYITTYIVMFVVAMSSSSLMTRLKKQSFENAKQVYRTQVLLEMSQMLQKANDMNAIYASMLKQLHKLLDTDFCR